MSCDCENKNQRLAVTVDKHNDLFVIYLVILFVIVYVSLDGVI